jgi:tRNA(Ile)-lysidine synthase
MASSRKYRSSDLAARVGGELRRHVPAGARLTLALSGGVDSIVLLDLLAALAGSHPFTLDCLHVNHGLSPNAAAWARFARAAARRYGLRCTVRKADLTPHRALGPEGAARAARYALFASAGSDFVALAQHADDQAETVLLQLVRGAGVAGLAAMPAVRVQRPGGRRHAPRLLRPLLGVSRSEIERYAQGRALDWVEDESNRDVRLARNLVRHHVLPLLREVNPAATANLARSAGLLAEAHELMQTLGAADAAAATRTGHLDVAALGALSRARAKNVLRWTLARAGLAVPDSAMLEEMLAQLVGARRDASVRFTLDGGEVRRFRGAVRVVPALGPVPARFRSAWPGRLRWPLPELGGELRLKPTVGRGLAAAALDAGDVEVRIRRGGERFRPDAARPRRELKTLLQESGIPPWERERLPLLYCGGRLAWVPGIGIEAGLRARPGERGIEPAWAHDRVAGRFSRSKAVIK